jgi:MOSC domain-containing protein YiiM
VKVLSVNVGQPREVVWEGRRILTGIYKDPVAGRVMVRKHSLAGDQQADLSVHGGPAKAVYAYPSEHYPYWKSELPDMELPYGMFGENLTTEGLLESEVRIGDRFRIGSAEVMVTQPRMPCLKLGIKFGRPDILKRFLRSGRSGFYLSIVREGEVGAGDEIVRANRASHDMSVTDIVRLYTGELDDVPKLRCASQIEALPQSWRENFREKLERMGEAPDE